MKQTVLCLLMAFSLLVAPIAHAAGLNCGSDGDKKIELSNIQKAVSEDGKQSNEKAQPCAHCYCCSHTLYDRTAAKAVHPSLEASNLAFATDTDKLTSLSVGPPSEPPLHA